MHHEDLCVTLVPLFNHLDITDQRKINQIVQHKHYQKGEFIFTPDTTAQLVIVARGQMKVYRLSANGKEQLLRVSEPGHYEGESALFGIQNENLYGEALQTTEVCVLRKDDFEKLLIDYPQLSLKLLKINAEKTTLVEQQTEFLTMEKIEERLAIYLLDLYKATDSLTFEIPMKMKELAGYLGTTPETLSRKFKLLENKEFIKRQRTKIEILSVEELEDL